MKNSRLFHITTVAAISIVLAGCGGAGSVLRDKANEQAAQQTEYNALPNQTVSNGAQLAEPLAQHLGNLCGARPAFVVYWGWPSKLGVGQRGYLPLGQPVHFSILAYTARPCTLFRNHSGC